MANSTTSISTTYNGEFAGKYVSAALLSGTTLSQGNITIRPNVKKKEVMKKVASTNIVKNGACDFSGQADVLTLTERVLTPEEFQVNLELCKKDYVADWEAVQMGYSAINQELPPIFSDWLIGHVAGKVAEKMEQNIWTGTDGNDGEFSGFVTTLTADDDVNDVTGTASTAGNIIEELGKIADAIPNAVYGAEDMKIFLPSNMYRNYVRALGGFGTSGLGAAGTGDRGTQWYNMGQGLSFDGIPVVLAPGLSDNDAVAAESSNLFFGTGLLSDHNEVKVLDMADLDGSQNVRVIMRFTAGIQHAIGGDIVLYATS